MADETDDSAPASTRREFAAASDPVIVRNPGAASRLVLLGDHAGCEIPPDLGDLGLPPAEITRHIGWDIGVADLGRGLSAILDATFIAQRYSRLVIDCNRDPARADAICETSDGTEVPGNAGLSPTQRQARIAGVFEPYHARIADELDRRTAGNAAPVLVALHSFTPVMGADPRPWRYGVLHLGQSAFSQAVLGGLRRRLGDAPVGDNAPYQMDGTDFTIPHHAVRRGLDYVELEVRQDLLSEAAGVAEAAALLGEVLQEALDQLSST